MTYSDINDLIDINLASGNKIPAIKHREVEHALLDYIQHNLSQSGDVKRVKCDLAYLNANFEVNGLGKNLRLGWAICNGINGTDNLAGRVGVGYGLGYSSLGSTGGSATHTLTINEIPAHTHASNGSTSTSGGSGQNVVNNANDNTADVITKSEGGGQPHNNMQPYIINLYIMKL